MPAFYLLVASSNYKLNKLVRQTSHFFVTCSTSGRTVRSLDSDFNNMLITGRYCGDTNNKTNCPVGSGQFMIMRITQYNRYIIQICITIPGSSLGDIFFRQRSSSGNWTAWSRLQKSQI